VFSSPTFVAAGPEPAADDAMAPRSATRRGGGCRRVLTSLAAAAALAAASRALVASFVGAPAAPPQAQRSAAGLRAWTPRVEEVAGSGSQEVSDDRRSLSRRGAISAVPALAALWVLSSNPQPAAALIAMGREEVAAAAEALKGLLGRWNEFEKIPGDAGIIAAGTALENVMGSTSQLDVVIEVPPGEALGIDIDGRTVMKVNKKPSLFKAGDTINEINGKETLNSGEIKKAIQKAQEANEPIKIAATRVLQTAFVTISRSLQLLYEDTRANLPEVDDVMNRVTGLKAKAGLMADAIGELSDIKPRIASLVVDLEAYAVSPSLADTPRPAPKVAAADGKSGDLDGLFG